MVNERVELLELEAGFRGCGCEEMRSEERDKSSETSRSTLDCRLWLLKMSSIGCVYEFTPRNINCLVRPSHKRQLHTPTWSLMGKQFSARVAERGGEVANGTEGHNSLVKLQRRRLRRRSETELCSPLFLVSLRRDVSNGSLKLHQ